MTSHPPELELLLRLDQPLQAWLHTPRAPRHTVFATDAEPDLSTLYVELRFLSGRSYCCLETDCHLPRRCDRLIRLAAEQAIHLPDNVTVRWHCVVEPHVYLQSIGSWTGPLPQEFEDVSGGSLKHIPKPPTSAVPPDFTGIWTSEFPGGRTEQQYRNGIKDGISRSWNQQGVCLREGFIRHGQWRGTLITRSSDGTILDSAVFDDGTGVYKIFNANDQLIDEIPMRSGKPHGASRTWLRGRLVLTRHYSDGLCEAANFEASTPPTPYRTASLPDRKSDRRKLSSSPHTTRHTW